MFRFFLTPLFVLWRLYDGRGYKLSEAAGWILSIAISAYLAWDQTWQSIVYGAGVGAAMFYVIQRGYEGWDQWLPMLKRSSFGAGAFLLWEILWDKFDPTMTTIIVLLLLVANVSQVPTRRLLNKGIGGHYMTHFHEAYEAAVVSIGLILWGWGS